MRSKTNPCQLLKRYKLFTTVMPLINLLLFNMALALPIKGIGFSHKDWLLTCDNSGTCHASGYQSYDDDFIGASILLTRKAGAGERVEGRVSLFPEENQTQNDPSWDATLWIGKQSYGKVPMHEYEGKLSPYQVDLILDNAKQNNRIAFTYKEYRWNISHQGMGAIFLKMDEFQGRLNTSSAVIARGNKPQTNLLQPQPIPTLTIPKILDNDKALKKHYLSHMDKIEPIAKRLFDEHCSYFDADKPLEISIYPLNNDYALISHRCWLAAYNSGDIYWMIDRNLTMKELVTTDGSYYDKGKIHLSHKGRGIGDCWSSAEYSWNGETFIQTLGSNTGLCRGMPGGYWRLPTLIYNVITE